MRYHTGKCVCMCVCIYECACIRVPEQCEYNPETGVPYIGVYTMACTTRAARHWIPLQTNLSWGWAMRKWGDLSSYCRINDRSGKWRQAGGLGRDVPMTLEDKKQRQPLLQAGIRGPNPAAVVGIPWVCSRRSLQLPHRASVVASGSGLHLTQWPLWDPSLWAGVSPPAGHNS